MGKIRIISRIVWIVLSIFFISFAIENNVGGLFGVCAAGAVIFWSIVGIWREITEGKRVYIVWKDGRPRLDRR